MVQILLSVIATLEALSLLVVVAYTVVFAAMILWVLLRLALKLPVEPRYDGSPNLDEQVKDFRKQLDSIEMEQFDWNQLRSRHR